MEHNATAPCPMCRGERENLENYVRRPYKSNSSDDRRRIVECANRGDDWRTLCKSLGIKCTTAYKWIRSGEVCGKGKGGRKPRLLTDEHMERIISWIELDPEISLRQLLIQLSTEFGIQCSRPTLSNYLEGMTFTVKKLHTIPTTMNSVENKQKRKRYLTALNEYVRNKKDIVWIDETNVNLFCRRNFGRSRKGTRAIKSLPASRGPNVHIIGAISCEGIVKVTTKRGSFKHGDVGEWVDDTLNQWQVTGHQLDNLVLVCDNAPCHARLENTLQERGVTLLRLGPYSPQLNPIENVWSVLKAKIKNSLRIPPIQEGNHIGEQRLRYLEQIINEAKDELENNIVVRSVQHTTTFYNAIMNEEDLAPGI